MRLLIIGTKSEVIRHSGSIPFILNGVEGIMTWVEHDTLQKLILYDTDTYLKSIEDSRNTIINPGTCVEEVSLNIRDLVKILKNQIDVDWKFIDSVL